MSRADPSLESIVFVISGTLADLIKRSFDFNAYGKITEVINDGGAKRPHYSGARTFTFTRWAVMNFRRAGWRSDRLNVDLRDCLCGIIYVYSCN